MTFEEAFDKAVKAYYEGAGFDEYEKATGSKIKYNKDFFDKFENDTSKKKKPKDKATDLEEATEDDE